MTRRHRKAYTASRGMLLGDDLRESRDFDTMEEADAFVRGWPCQSISFNRAIPLEALQRYLDEQDR